MDTGEQTTVAYYLGATYRYRKGKRKYSGRLSSIIKKYSDGVGFSPTLRRERQCLESYWAQLVSGPHVVNIPLRKLKRLSKQQILEAKLCDSNIKAVEIPIDSRTKPLAVGTDPRHRRN